MKVSTRERTNDTIIEISGRLDSSSSSDLEDVLNELINKKREVVLDFKKVEYVSSAGLRVFLSAQKRMMEYKKNLSIINANKVVKEVLDTTGFSSILDVK